jgi:H+/Cl- antiporter ClcA
MKRWQLSTPQQASALFRSRGYLLLLALAAVFGVAISALSYLFLAAVNKLQKWLYTMLPGQLGFHGVPAWWPFPLLLLGGLSVAAAIKYLPGTGGHKPADGLKVGGVAAPAELPGIALAALLTLGSGAVLGPEAPLIALGGGLCAWAVRHAVKGDASQPVVVLGAAGSFAAISTLLGSPLVGAFLLMEAAGLTSATLELVLLPGLLAAGLGALVFTGLGHWTGLGTFSLALPGLPHIARPNLEELGWAIVVGLAAAVIVAAIRRLALRIRRPAERWIMLATPAAGLVVAGLAVLFSQVTGQNVKYVLFSGQNELAPLFAHRAAFGIGALFLIVACKGLAYSVSLATFRGGPVFPAIYLGAALGLLLAQVPGVPVVAGMGIGIGATTAAMLRLPLTAALLAALLLSADAASVTPLAIVAVVVAYIASEHLDPRIAAQAAATTPPAPGAPGTPAAPAAPGTPPAPAAPGAP